MSLQDFHTRLELIFKTKTQSIVPEQLMDNIKHYLTIKNIVYNGFKRHAKLFELNLFIQKLSPDCQTRQAKSAF